MKYTLLVLVLFLLPGVVHAQDESTEQTETRDDSEESSGGGLVNWQTTGFLITERLFLNLHEKADGGRWGPEIEIRIEKTPLRDVNFWAMISFRYYWSVLEI